jgi:hypothetical protein
VRRLDLIFKTLAPGAGDVPRTPVHQYEPRIWGAEEAVSPPEAGMTWCS